MNINILNQILKDFPNTAKVYRESDHSQQAEASPTIMITRDKELPYYGEDINWEYRDSFPHAEITAINIC